MRGFREVGWVAAVAGTALGCYMVSLKVASERAALEQVENRIVLAQRDIRLLQTEIGTRGRLAQLEQWNVKVLALSAPKANQFLEGSFQLATLAAPHKVVDPQAPVVLASAPAGPPAAPVTNGDDSVAGVPSISSAPTTAVAPAPKVASPSEMMHVASLRHDLGAAAPGLKPQQKVVEKPAVRPATAATSAKAPATKTAESSVRQATKAVIPAKAKPAPAKIAATKVVPSKPVPTKSNAREAATDR